MEQMNRYFTNADHANLIFFQFPKLLMYGEKYREMSSDSKLLYMLSLDLIKLSMKHGWKDKEGRYYIKMSLETIQDRLNCAKQKAQKLKKELETFGLLEEERIGLGKSNRLYVLQLEYTDQDIIKANIDHEDIENDEVPEDAPKTPEYGSEKPGDLEPQQKDENHPPEVRKSSPIKNNNINNNSKDLNKEIDDDKRTSPGGKASPAESNEYINKIISNFYEEVKLDLTDRSFKSVVRKVMDKYHQGKIKGSFRDYLATALINKIEELELRRIKDVAKQKLREKSSEEIADKLQTLKVSDNIPFYNWLEED